MDELAISRVDHLLIVGHALRRFGLRELIDDRCPRDPRSLVSAGECVEALVATILLGGHTLYLVHDGLAPYDLQLAFGWQGRAEHFHDNRIGKALDQAFEAGVVSLYSAAVLRAIEVHELELKRLHLDTTSLKLFGQYEGSEEPDDPDDPQAIPQVARGFSKDHRPDLKQVVFLDRLRRRRRARVRPRRLRIPQRLARVAVPPRATRFRGIYTTFGTSTTRARRRSRRAWPRGRRNPRT